LCELEEITGTFTTPDVSPYPELPSLPIAHDDHRYRGDVRMVYGNYWLFMIEGVERSAAVGL
jgi:hypothetical protein